jgi:hypothetical protein
VHDLRLLTRLGLEPGGVSVETEQDRGKGNDVHDGGRQGR